MFEGSYKNILGEYYDIVFILGNTFITTIPALPFSPGCNPVSAVFDAAPPPPLPYPTSE